MRNITKGIVSLLLITGLVPVLNADSIFNFDDQTLGAVDPITETNNGVTATFQAVDTAGNPVPGSYDIETNPSGIGSGLRLIRSDPSVATNVPLNLLITLSAAQQSVSFPFALLGLTTDPTPPELTVNAFLNGTPVGSTPPTLTTTNLPPPPQTKLYSIGTIAFDAGAGNTFNSLLLNPNVIGLGIDDVNVSPSGAVSGVPEPASVALMFFGLAGILAYVRRRRLHNEAA